MFTEERTVEQPILKFLSEQLGYEFVAPDVIAEMREYESDVYLKDYFVAAIQKINGCSAEIAEEVLSVLKKVSRQPRLFQTTPWRNTITKDRKKVSAFQPNRHREARKQSFCRN